MECFKRGEVLLRTPHYYRTHDEPGRADRFESCVGFYDKNRGHNLPKFEIPIDVQTLNDVQSVLIYPMNEPNDAWIQSWSAVGTHNNFEDSLSRMIKEFGSYFVFLPAKRIATYEQRLSKKSRLVVKSGLVEYTKDSSKRSLMMKTIDFEYQREYRFLVGECEKNYKEDLNIKVGNMQPILTEAMSFKFLKPDGTSIYCGIGDDKVLSVEL